MTDISAKITFWRATEIRGYPVQETEKRASKKEIDGLHTADSDEEDVRLVATGDRMAAARLVNAHGDRLMAVAWRMLGSREAAEDVVQEAFIRMWQHAKDWQPGAAKFSTWLHRVAVNLCYDRLRKASYRYEHPAGDDLPDMASDRPDAEAVLTRTGELTALRNALDRLPPRQKMAVILCHYEEHSNAAAAAMMEISLEALESLLSRARRSLKADLKLKEDLALGA